ncbi:MAG: TauD/TfdA family dioxygenase [Paracraurococcus sp.]
MTSTLTRPASLARGISLHPLHPDFGVEFRGVDLAAAPSPYLLDLLHDALIEHGVLLLRGQGGLAERVASGLAALEASLLGQALHQAPPALPLSVGAVPDLPPPGRAPGPFWHADRSYAAEPGLACLLHATGTEIAIGDEIAFADQRRALASLPAALRDHAGALRAEHANPRDPAARTEHPVLRRHPVTGEPSLYVNPAFTTRILNLPAAQSDRLLRTLLAAATAEAITWRHRWQAGDVLIWDNRCLLHSASSGPALHALRIEGDRPVPAAQPMPWVMAG